MSGVGQTGEFAGAAARAGDPAREDAREDARDLLAAHLLPTLLHGLGNHTQFLTGLRAVLTMPGGSKVLHDKASALADVSAQVEDAGWMLAMLASAAGSNLLLARREQRGLQIACELVDDALRRAGAARTPAPASGENAPHAAWPLLAPTPFPGDQGWQLPWSIASLLLAAGLDQAHTDRLDFTWSTDLDLPRGTRVDELVPLVRERLPAARVQLGEGRARLELPADWLVR